jgi:hypothetical protein
MIKVLKNEVKLKMAENLVYRKSKAYLKHLILRK